MRISAVNNYNQTKTSFGKFATGDKNARKVVEEALKTNDGDSYTQSMHDLWFDRIEKCDFFEVYTDKEDNTVKGRFVDEFVKSNKNDRRIAGRLEDIEIFGILNDLSVLKNVRGIAGFLRDFVDILNGVDLSERTLSSNPYGDARIGEQRSQEMLDGLAD